MGYTLHVHVFLICFAFSIPKQIDQISLIDQIVYQRIVGLEKQASYENVQIFTALLRDELDVIHYCITCITYIHFIFQCFSNTMANLLVIAGSINRMFPQ